MEIHLITKGDVLSLARPTSVHVDESDVDVFIDETEQLDIIPAIGCDLFLDIQGNLSGPKYETLLMGGVYVGRDGKKHLFKGLKTAMAYYVYARLVKNDGRILSESGFLSHNDEYGEKVDDKQKYASYHDALNVGKRYLADVLNYLKTTNQTFDKRAKVKNNGTRIIAIGE
ncbi:DUF6712 family protein [Bacteroides neonati]|uniref:DUF6712 family protein n=2 Tax=Bacteroides TaxID=816 RepID=UPI0004B4A9B4|nr:hypothetical protein [Bacteroides neonati]